MSSSPRHIAFVSPRFAEGQTVGGAETLLKHLALRLAARGYRITFLATCAENHITWENSLPPGPRAFGPIQLIRFPVDRKKDPGAFSDIQTEIVQGVALSGADERTWIENSVNSEALYEHIRSHAAEYDLLITGPYLFGVSWFAAQIIPEKTLLVPCLHNEPFARPAIMRQLFHAVRGILYNAEPEARLAERLYGVAPEKGRVVGMGLDTFEADPDAFRRKYRIERPFVFYAGRRETGKGTPLMTRYLATFRERTGRDVALVCAGSGEIVAPSELRPHITDLGFVSEEDKHNAMAAATVFIHPSTFESFGIVLLESFLAGTPALVHAAAEVLQWQCRRANAGFWFRHCPDFEEALALLLDRPDLRSALGRNGGRFVREHYSWSAVEERLLSAIKELVP